MSQGLVLFSVLYIVSIIMTFSCMNWFLLWLGLEINMMSFIVMMYRRSSLSVEVCLKYFFIQSLGSGILMMMFYSEFFWFDFISLSVLSYKMGGGPFYFWFPYMCEMLSWMMCYLLMTIQKILPLLIMSFMVSMFLWFIVFSSIVIGAFGSMNQKSMKRLMAYSSIHHIGWILMGNFLWSIMWVVYLFMYMLLISGVMISLWKDKILDVGMLKKLSSKWSFVLGMLSMGGMPPLLGFYLKWWLFYNLMFMDYSLLLFMMIMSVLMFYIYIRVVYMMIVGGSMEWSWNMKNKNKKNINLDLFYVLGINTGMILWLLFM